MQVHAEEARSTLRRAIDSPETEVEPESGIGPQWQAWATGSYQADHLQLPAKETNQTETDFSSIESIKYPTQSQMSEVFPWEVNLGILGWMMPDNTRHDNESTSRFNFDLENFLQPSLAGMRRAQSPEYQAALNFPTTKV